MSNVQPGNLAMVVNAEPPWGGATCTVVESAEIGNIHPDQQAYVTGKGPFWWVKMARPMPLWHATLGHMMGVDCVMPDAHLRKIGGPDVDVDTMEFNPLAHEQTA